MTYKAKKFNRERTEMISQAIHASIKKEFFLSVKKLAVLLSFFVRQCCHVAYFFRAIYKLIFFL